MESTNENIVEETQTVDSKSEVTEEMVRAAIRAEAMSLKSTEDIERIFGLNNAYEKGAFILNDISMEINKLRFSLKNFNFEEKDGVIMDGRVKSIILTKLEEAFLYSLELLNETEERKEERLKAYEDAKVAAFNEMKENAKYNSAFNNGIGEVERLTEEELIQEFENTEDTK